MIGLSKTALGSFTSASVFLAAILWSCPTNAHAYLDPSTTGSLAQVAIAMVIGAGYAVQRFWNRITSGFKKMIGRGTSND